MKWSSQMINTWVFYKFCILLFRMLCRYFFPTITLSNYIPFKSFQQHTVSPFLWNGLLTGWHLKGKNHPVHTFSPPHAIKMLLSVTFDAVVASKIFLLVTFDAVIARSRNGGTKRPAPSHSSRSGETPTSSRDTCPKKNYKDRRWLAIGSRNILATGSIF